MAFATVIATAGLASAHIVWTASGQRLINHATGQCLTDRGYGYAGMDTCTSSGLIYGTQMWQIYSAAPDAGGNAYVQIKSMNSGMCIYATTDPGPSQFANSHDVELTSCNAAAPATIWAMSTAFARSGTVAHVQFFTFSYRVCLDGGIGVYGFAEPGCNAANNYQVWDYDHGQYNDDGSPI